MKKIRKLSVIREDIAALKRWIRRAEEDGVNWHEVAKARARLTELQTEEFRVLRDLPDEPNPGPAAA